MTKTATPAQYHDLINADLRQAIKEFVRDELKVNLRTQVRGALPNRNLATLNMSNPTLFTGINILARGGTAADLSGEGPGVVQMTDVDEPFSVAPVNLASASYVTGLLGGANGGMGVNNSTRTLTINTNSGTLAFSASGKTLTIADTGTAALGTGSAGRAAIWTGANTLSSDTALLWDNTNKRLQVGAGTLSTAEVGLGVAFTDPAAASALAYGSLLEFTTAPGATALSASKRGQGFFVFLTGSGGGASGGLLGIVGEAQNQQTAGTIGSATAASLGIRLTNAGSITTASGCAVIPILSSSGNLTTWNGFLARSPSRSSSGSITTAYGFYAEKQTVTGVTTGYGIFQADAADVNFFGGPIIMQEVTAPGAPAANQGILYLDDNGAGKTRLNIRFNTGAVQVIATQP